MNKECSTCHIVQDINNFWVENSQKDGHCNVCKDCKRYQAVDRFRRRKSANVGDTATKKICRECGIEHDISLFNRSFSQPDGYSPLCFACRKEHRRRLEGTIIRTEKRCIVCGMIRDISLFHKNKSTPDGHQCTCKICGSIHSKKGYRDTLLRFQTLKQSLTCVQCGERHYKCLSFHHRNPEDKVFNVGQYLSKASTWQKLLDEVAKCDVLCENCHRKLHYPDPSHKTLMWRWGLKEGRACQVCGESHFSCLDFHHRDAAEKTFGINKIQVMGGMTKVKALAEIDKCDVLCGNCHIKLHAKGEVLMGCENLSCQIL